MTNESKGKLISYRAKADDMRIINEAIARDVGIRETTPSDVIRYGLSLVDSQKKNIKKVPSDVIHVGLDTAMGKDMTVLTMPSNENRIVGTPEEVPQKQGGDGSGGYISPEDIAKGYGWIRGELCDKDGFPVISENGDVVIRGGEVYAIDPKRSELKEKAAENMAEVVGDTQLGTANPALASFLGEQGIHAVPGMLTTQHEGVDEEADDMFEDGLQDSID